MGESAKSPRGMARFLKEDTQQSRLLNSTHRPAAATLRLRNISWGFRGDGGGVRASLRWVLGSKFSKTSPDGGAAAGTEPLE